jgi:hypothetical protein
MSAVPQPGEPAPRRARRAYVWLFLSVLTAAPVAADVVRPISLAQMTRAAGTIVVGRVTEVRLDHLPQHPRVPVTYVTLRVEETWKGAPARDLTFMQFGDATGAAPLPATPGRVQTVRFPEMPTYAAGEEILLFLRRPSRVGLTSPVGGHDGKLAVYREVATGQLVAQGGPADLAGSTHAGTVRRGPVALAALRARVSGAATEEGRGQ